MEKESEARAGVSIEIRSHEQSQLEEMLPILQTMYDEQYYEEGVEEVADMLEALEYSDDFLTLPVDQWKTLMVGVNSPHVKGEQGGISDTCQRPQWLSKKFAKRLEAKGAFEEEDDESEEEE